MNSFQKKTDLLGIRISIALVILLSQMAQITHALIQVPVNQYSSFIPYNESAGTGNLHAYFDVGYDKQGELIQADGTNTYYFSKVCKIDPTNPSSFPECKLVPIHQHSTRNNDCQSCKFLTISPSQIYPSIIMNSYEVYGLCQEGGVLDYVVALDINSNEIRVVRFTTDAYDTSTIYIKDYKKVDKDDDLIKIEDGLLVDCYYQGNFKGQNYYTIAIGGTYINQVNLTNYFFAKFSTKYNFTEFMITSENQMINETAVGVSVDENNQMVYIAVMVEEQIYFNRTVYQPGDEPGVNNPNIAVHGYSWFFGVRTWTTLLGDPTYPDQFSRMKAFGNSLYVFLNSQSTQYSPNSTQTDIFYYRLRSSNGFVEASQIFGSSGSDNLLDLDINFQGLYLLAYIENGLLPHRDNDKQWQTQGLISNIAVIWMDFSDNILDIEGHATNMTISPYPMKIMTPSTVNDQQTYVFASARTNNLIDINGGFFLSYFYSPSLLFGQQGNCPTGCQKCSQALTSVCMSCAPGYFLFQGVCNSGQCADFSYGLYDSKGSPISACQECHYSCMTCSGPRSTQCTTCCTDNVCGPIYNRLPNLGECTCPSGLIDSNGICVQSCVLNLAGLRNQMCYPRCSGDSWPLLEYDQATAQPSSQYDPSSLTDCPQSQYHMKFSVTGQGLALPAPPQLSQVPSEFTVGVWVMPTALNPYSYVANLFNRAQIRIQSVTYKVSFLFFTSVSNKVEPFYTNDYRQEVVLGSWNYIMVSLRSITVGGVQKFEQQLAVSNSNTGTLNNGGYANTNPYVNYGAFTSTIYLGELSDQTPQSFTGYLKEFKLFTKFHSYAQMQADMRRLYRYYSYDDPFLIAYWKLSEPYTSQNTSYVIGDYSYNQLSYDYSIVFYPNMPSFVLDMTYILSLCIFHDVSVCLSPDYSSTQPYVVGGKRLTSPPNFVLANTLYFTQNQGDQIWFVPNNTNCTYANALAYMTYVSASSQWTVPNSAMSPVFLLEGTHYQVCYYAILHSAPFNLYQTYLITKPITIDPSTSNGFMAGGVSRTFQSDGGDQSFGDVIKFSLDCTQPQSTDYEMIRDNSYTF